MPSIVDRFVAFRQTRQARAIAVGLLFVAAALELHSPPGPAALLMGSFFLAVGLLGAYRLLTGAALTDRLRE